MLFKVQRIRSCVQCGDLQPLKCDKCVKHPDRKPRVIELYDWPPILDTAPCGCLLIQCQAPGCTNKKWRYARLKSKTGKSVAKTFCCSKQCATTVANAVQRSTTITMPCDYCGVKKSVIASVMKIRKHVFCDPSHYYLWVRKQAFEVKQKELALAKLDEYKAMVFCQKCDDIVECVEVPANYFTPKMRYRCKKRHAFQASTDHHRTLSEDAVAINRIFR